LWIYLLSMWQVMHGFSFNTWYYINIQLIVHIKKWIVGYMCIFRYVSTKCVFPSRKESKCQAIEEINRYDKCSLNTIMFINNSLSIVDLYFCYFSYTWLHNSYYIVTTAKTISLYHALWLCCCIHGTNIVWQTCPCARKCVAFV
jgi:hypothetical protein